MMRQASETDMNFYSSRPPSKWRIHPASKARHIWDIWMTIVSTVYLFFLPFEFTFSWNHNLGLIMLFVSFDIFLVMDVISNFFTGYVDHVGKLHMALHEIRNHYLKGTFRMDAAGSFPVGVLLLTYAGSLRPSPVMCAILTILWILRLPRLARGNAILKYYDHTSFVNVLRIFRLCFIVIFGVHVTGCLWFVMMQLLHEEGAFIWERFQNTETVTQYWTSMHTAFMMMMGEDTQPITVTEKIFTLLVLLFGAVMVATIFGSVSILISELNAESMRFQRKMEGVNSYMKCLSIPDDLKRRVRQFYIYKWGRSGGVTEEDFLLDLSDSLRADVLQFLRKDVLEKVPFFQRCSLEFIDDIIAGMKRAIFLPDDIIIRHDKPNTAMYVVSNGCVEVNRPGSAPPLFAKQGDFFGEEAFQSVVGVTHFHVGPQPSPVAKRKSTGLIAKALTHTDVYMLTQAVFQAALVRSDAKTQSQVVQALHQARVRRLTAGKKSKKKGGRRHTVSFREAVSDVVSHIQKEKRPLGERVDELSKRLTELTSLVERMAVAQGVLPPAAAAAAGGSGGGMDESTTGDVDALGSAPVKGNARVGEGTFARPSASLAAFAAPQSDEIRAKARAANASVAAAVAATAAAGGGDAALSSTSSGVVVNNMAVSRDPAVARGRLVRQASKGSGLGSIADSPTKAQRKKALTIVTGEEPVLLPGAAVGEAKSQQPDGNLALPLPGGTVPSAQPSLALSNRDISFSLQDNGTLSGEPGASPVGASSPSPPPRRTPSVSGKSAASAAAASLLRASPVVPSPSTATQERHPSVTSSQRTTSPPATAAASDNAATATAAAGASDGVGSGGGAPTVKVRRFGRSSRTASGSARVAPAPIPQSAPPLEPKSNNGPGSSSATSAATSADGSSSRGEEAGGLESEEFLALETMAHHDDSEGSIH